MVQVRANCEGPIPPPLARWSVLPRPEAGYVLGVRADQTPLSSFELAAFRAACTEVVEESLDDMALAVARLVRQAGRAGTVSLDSLKVMQLLTCVEAGMCRTPEERGVSHLKQQQQQQQPQDSKAALPVADRLMGEPCVYLSQGWWAAAVCAGASVTQFHAAEGVVESQILLGVFDAAATAAANAGPPRYLDEGEGPVGPSGLRPAFQEEIFVGGAVCAAEGGHLLVERRAAVRWVCAPDGFTRVTLLEASLCNYLITVHSADLC